MYIDELIYSVDVITMSSVFGTVGRDVSRFIDERS